MKAIDIHNDYFIPFAGFGTGLEDSGEDGISH